ncbi:hypothetical protein [Rufibacter psychrotolerans]|uniref:hypothetical protein n=1 Tax=Rufibacter psychrotolerans TaxID=2812556 RepID=UPI00196719CB|nr:hypothetical protein [Rufibacter sp. SYSU D00308]
MEKDIKVIESYYEFQRREWKAFRVFWWLMGLVLLAAAFGLFGRGMLSDKTYAAHGTQIEYNKFMRVEKGTELHISVAGAGQGTTISFNNDYIRKVRIDQVIPEPATVEVKDQKLVYTFPSAQNGLITFFLVPHKMGRQRLEITVGPAQLRETQFIYF